MKYLIVILSAFTSTAFAAQVTQTCKPVLGRSVYTELTLKYEADEYEITSDTLILNGEGNPNHEDATPGEEEPLRFVTAGDREAKVEDKDDTGQFGFYLDTCVDCDFNSARYEYRSTGEVGENFLIEDYGSDATSELSVYQCSDR